MATDKVREIEEKIADLKARWPAHSVPPSMWQKLEELEDELEKANFYLEKELSGMLIHDNRNLEKGRILNFRKG